MVGRGKDVGGGGGDDLAGQEHVYVGIPEEATLPVVGLLGMSSGGIPRSLQACSDKNRV